MQLHELAETLKITPVPECNPEVEVNFLADTDQLIRTAVQFGLSTEIAEAMRPYADKLCSNAALMSYFNFLAGALFNDRLSREREELLPKSIGILSPPEEYAFFALVVFTSLNSRRRVFASAGLPPECADGAIEDVFLWIEHFFSNQHLAGLNARAFRTEYYAQNGIPLRIGRLQYVLKHFPGLVRGYRNRLTGEVQALYEPGFKFNRSGMLDGVTGDCDPVAWVSTFEENDHSATGHPVLPAGRTSREKITLSTREWQCVLRKDDWVLDICIPEGSGMTPDVCRTSMTTALDFFRKRYPDRRIRGFCCFSWLLDPQYEFLLKPDSRILAFMRQYYLFPTQEDGTESMWRIFGENAQFNPPEELPRRTGMQRNVADFLAKGGKLRSGGGFYLVEDIDRYGSMPYRQTGQQDLQE